MPKIPNKKDDVLTISKTFLPRRSDTATMATHKAGIILSKGELFLEYPNSGPGTKGQYYFKVGDGVTPYKDLPYAFGNASDDYLKFTDIDINEGDEYTFNDAMEAIISGASFGDVISNIKFALKNLFQQFSDSEADADKFVSDGDRENWDKVAIPVKVNTGSLNDMREPGTRYYADASNSCTNKPNGNRVDGFGMEVYLTSTGHVCQEVTEDITGIKYIRIWNGSSFGPWSQIYTSSDPPAVVETARKAQNDALGQKIDETYIKGLAETATSTFTNLTHSDKKKTTTHELTLTKGNNTETKFTFNDENTQYQMHVKNASNQDGNVKVELTSTDSTSNTVTVKGDGKGSKVTSTNDEITVATDYKLTTENAFVDGDQSGASIVLTDINGNRKVVTIRSVDETEVYANGSDEINFYIPNVAIERLVKVVDQAARFALTYDDVQNGDSVYQIDTNTIYMVIDDSNLDSELGYQSYEAHKAAELTSPRKIDGVEFSGKSDINHYTVCSTAAATAAKAASLNNFKLVSGAVVNVKFDNTDTAGSITLDISGTGAKNVKYGDAAVRAGLIKAGHAYTFLYDGTNYNLIAGKLTSKFNIDGIDSLGDNNINHYTVCSTAAATVEKAVTVSNFSLVTGSRVLIKFNNTNTAANPTLNVNGTGAKDIRTGSANIRASLLKAGYVYEFVYDGTYWQMVLGRFSNAITVDGVSFQGDNNIIHYGICSTAASTAAKTVVLSNFTLATGATVIVKFSYTDTAGSCTLNVNSTGAKNIRVGGANIRAHQLQANYSYEFVYDGTYWELMQARALYFDGGDEG